MGGTIIEGEGEMEFGSGALVVVKAIAEGLQESFRHEEERLVAIDRRLELMSDAIVIPGAVEFKESVMFPVSNVVELGKFLAETLGEALTREPGQIIESLKPPELQDGGVGKRKGLCGSEIGEFESEGILMVGTKGSEVGEIGSFTESDLKRESEIGGGLDGLGHPILLRSHEESGEVEQVGFRRGELEVGNEGIDKSEGFAAG